MKWDGFIFDPDYKIRKKSSELHQLWVKRNKLRSKLYRSQKHLESISLLNRAIRSRVYIFAMEMVKARQKRVDDAEQEYEFIARLLR